MRHLAIALTAALLTASCGQSSNAGCDGAACGGPVDPGCSPGETVACVCDDGASGTKPCGADACGCEPEEPACREGELVACTCGDGTAGTKACGAEVCVCTPPACALRNAEALAFGGVPPGFVAESALALVNEGGAPCAVSGIRLDGCDDAFGLGLAAGELTVPAYGSASIPVSFRALREAQAPCALRFETSDPEAPARTVSLSGHADPACVSVEPRALALAVDTAGCGTARGTVTVSNRCGVPLQLDGLSLDGGAFLLLAEPPRPATVAPGATAAVVVGYRPEETGGHEAALTIGLAGLDPVSIALSGVAGEGTWVTDEFEQNPRPQVDLLFVIDNGLAMADDQETLAMNLAPFVSFALAQEVDFHLGVTTTGLEPGGDCPGGVGGGEDGRLFPVIGATPRVLAEETPLVETAWRTNTAVGACREGPNQVFEAALRALEPPLVDAADDERHPEANDGNAGFLRPGAHLSVVAITDRPDTSPEEPGFYYNALQRLKGTRNTHLFNFHAVTGDRRIGCGEEKGRSAGPGDRLIDVVEATDGGVFQSICASDWEMAFREMSAAAFGFRTCFMLTDWPADRNGDGQITDTEGELAVTKEGVELPSRGAQGQRIWAYGLELNAVCFYPLAVPEPGTKIAIRYRVSCPA